MSIYASFILSIRMFLLAKDHAIIFKRIIDKKKIKTKKDHCQNYSEEKKIGKKQNNKYYQFDVYFVNDHQSGRDYFCKNRPNMDW